MTFPSVAGLIGGPVLLPAIKYVIMSNTDIVGLLIRFFQNCLMYALLGPFKWVFVIFNIVQALLWIGSTPS